MRRDDTIRNPLNAPSLRELSSKARLRELRLVRPRANEFAPTGLRVAICFVCNPTLFGRAMHAPTLIVGLCKFCAKSAPKGFAELLFCEICLNPFHGFFGILCRAEGGQAEITFARGTEAFAGRADYLDFFKQ